MTRSSYTDVNTRPLGTGRAFLSGRLFLSIAHLFILDARRKRATGAKRGAGSEREPTSSTGDRTNADEID